MFEEQPAEAWRKRYGSLPPSDLPNLEAFLNHRSVRDYDGRPVPEDVVRGLVAAAQSAATSSNLQLWSVVTVQNAERRAELAHLCGDQSQVRECAWFFAFLADHSRIRYAANRVGEPAAGLDYSEFFTMAVIDASLAAERMVCAAESLGLGICYIGGLRNDPAGVKRVLDLPEGVFGVFGLCVGWPKSDSEAEIKPRLRPEAVWFREKYDHTPDVEEYDGRMRAFYESQRMKGEVTWSMRSGRRVSPGSMTGRHILKEWLESQGFNLR